MKWNKNLTWVTIGYILVNILFTWHASTMTGGSSLIYAIIYPAFWGLTLIIVSIWTYRKRKTWFRKEKKLSTLLLLIFCTPLPLLIFNELAKPEITRSGSSYSPKNGITIKTETWVYSPGQLAIKKFWKLDSEKWAITNENNFKKDSLWVYFDKKGDTIRTEKFENNKLIETREYKE